MIPNYCKQKQISEIIPQLQQTTSIPSFFYKLNNYNTLEKIHKKGQDERQSEEIINESLTHNQKDQYKKEDKSSSEIDQEFDDILFHQYSNEQVKLKNNFEASYQQNFFQQYKEKIRKQMLQYNEEGQKSSDSNSQIYKRSKKRRQQISCRFSINQQDEQNALQKYKIYRQLSSNQFQLLEKSQNYQEYCKIINSNKKIQKSNKFIKTIKRKTQIQEKKNQMKHGKKKHANFLIESKAIQSESQAFQFELSSLFLHENSFGFNQNFDKQQISNMDNLII